jgi:RNA polymerase sigma-70 factor (ECF subfamily)
MAELPRTRASLLIRLCDASDADAWSEFVELYGPVVYRFGRQRGLQDADAADLTQIVFQELSRDGVRRYVAERGSFRNWLFGMVRNQLRKLCAKCKPGLRGSGNAAIQEFLEQQPGGAEESALWEKEYLRQRFIWAADKLRPQFTDASWEAFRLTALEAMSPSDVANLLGMSVGAVYTAKSRVLDRIRKEVHGLLDEE